MSKKLEKDERNLDINEIVKDKDLDKRVIEIHLRDIKKDEEDLEAKKVLRRMLRGNGGIYNNNLGSVLK